MKNKHLSWPMAKTKDRATVQFTKPIGTNLNAFQSSRSEAEGLA